MPERADRLVGGFVGVDHDLEREFEARLVESSTLAFRVAYSVLRHRQDAEDATRPDDKNSASFTYQDVGMNINSQAVSTDDGRFRIEITIQDTSVYSEPKSNPQGEPPTLKDIPTFRTFTSSQTLILKDGQTTQFTTATDRVSGEVTKVDVTLTVVK